MVVTLLAGCGRPQQPAGRRTTPGGTPARINVTPAALPPAIAPPVIRIGLKTDARSVTFSASASSSGTTGAVVFFSDGEQAGAVEESQLVLGLSSIPKVAVRYSVQLASFSTRDRADQARAEFRQKSGDPSFVFENPDLHTFQLRAGPFESKEKAQQAIDNLKESGYPGAFYVEDSSLAGAALPEIIVRGETGEPLMKSSKPVMVWTGDQQLVIDGETYRGQATVRVNDTGRLTVVNSLNMEDYLKGVVPNEIGPANSATYEALKAQAVAARTYAWKNRKQFDADGYDICSTPRCQVYAGIKTENELTSDAVRETSGEVITYGGEPINAVYTSTCGGRTENGEYMFDGWNYPYLKGVDCYPEETGTGAAQAAAVRLKGSATAWPQAWLELKAGIPTPADPAGKLTVPEAEAAVGQLLRYLGKNACAGDPLPSTSWIDMGDFLISQLCWQGKRDSLLQDQDYQYFLNHLTFSVFPKSEAHSFLALFHEGILVPSELSHFNPHSAVPRTDFYQALFQLLDHYHQVNNREGQIREVDEHTLQVVDDFGVHSFDLSDPLLLYQKIGDKRAPRTELVCSVGDKVEYLADGDRVQLLVCELSQSGIAMDRSSKYSFWQETATPEELGKRVSKYLDIGDIVDLQPLSYGVSKRVYEMKFLGRKGSGVLKGIRVRWALGLKDNLFVIDRLYDDNGRVTSFLFSGRGWGHGLGMCQVGAVGYAKQGKDYRFILKHYYTGVDLSKVY